MSEENVELLMIAQWVGEAAARFGGIPNEAAFYAAEAHGFQRETAAFNAFVAAYLWALPPRQKEPPGARAASLTPTNYTAWKDASPAGMKIA